MSLPLKQLNTVGVQITDEIVRCNEPYTDGSFTGYRGYLAYTCNGNIYGKTSSVNTVWTSSNKAGTHLFALLACYPTDTTAISIDNENGYVFSTTSRAVYLHYTAHEPIKHNICNTQIDVPYLLTTGVATTIATRKYPFPAKFGYVVFDCEGALPSADVTFTLSNGTETITATMSHTNISTLVEFSAPFKVNYGETLTVSTTNGYGCSYVHITLFDV